jgi:hypothetical protein
MNKFTEYNTKGATHWAIVDKSRIPCFYEIQDKVRFRVLYMDCPHWQEATGKPFFESIKLSRSTKETKEYHTDFHGVTQYAQPQGNEIDWIHGSEYYKPSTKEFIRMPASGNYAEYWSGKHQGWRVSGLIPVDNLSRSYFIKRAEWPSCDSQENIGSGIKPKDINNMTEKADGMHYDAFISAGWTRQGLIDEGYLFDFSDGVKPTFTQAQADAGELPAVGAMCVFASCDWKLNNNLELDMEVEIINHFVNNGVPVAVFKHQSDKSSGFDVEIGDNTCFKPIQTAEDKTREVVCGEIIDAGLANCTGVNDVIDLMFNSEKFTIVLNEGVTHD